MAWEIIMTGIMLVGIALIIWKAKPGAPTVSPEPAAVAISPLMKAA